MWLTYHCPDYLYMKTTFKLTDPEECAELNGILNDFGIHVEQDLFNNPYILLDPRQMRSLSSHGGRPPRITEETRKKACALKAEGHTVRQISAELGISIGSVSAVTKSFNHK